MLFRIVSSVFAHVAAFIIFSCAAMLVQVARLSRRFGIVRPQHRPIGQLQLLLTGTFYENWFRSHILPLSATTTLERIYVVTDQPLLDVDKVSYLCPPRWTIRLFGRTIARTIIVLWASMRYRPDVLMGYAIVPNAILCLVAASIFGGQSMFQMTGGPIQIIGGGAGSENALMCRLNRNSRVLENLLYHLVRLFDVVVVRGQRAVEFLQENRLAHRIAVVTGSVDTRLFHPDGSAKQYDLVIVARHIKEKRVHLFLDIVERLRKLRPHVRAALVGEGPLTEELKARAKRLRIEANVHFLGKLNRVHEVLRASKVFLLTSQTEGLSIAMLEAMASGLPVLAPNVGELGELLDDKETGIVVQPEDVPATARQVLELLEDQTRLALMSQAAQKRAFDCYSIAAVTRKWDRYFNELLGGSESTNSAPLERNRHGWS